MPAVLRTLIVTAILAVVVAGSIVYWGLYNVAATEPHWNATRWVLETMTRRSIRRQAAGVAAPARDKGMVERGFGHYGVLCVSCHGAPGIERSDIGRGLYPLPPDLSQSADELTAAELYWITKNGIKMTGMPAFGPSHDEEELWALVAFLEELPHLSPEDYRALGLR